MSLIKVRTAGIADIYNLYTCNKSVLPVYYGMEDYLLFITIYPNKEVILAEDEKGNLYGFLVAEYNKSNVHILSFGVYPEYRRMGIGSKLIDGLVNKVVNGNSIKTMTLYVHEDNDSAIKFYEKYGFNKIKRIKNYYAGVFKNPKSTDAFLMEKKILP